MTLRKKNITSGIVIMILLAAIVISVCGTVMTKAGYTELHDFWLCVSTNSTEDDETWDITTCYEKSTTSDMEVLAYYHNSYGTIQISAIGADLKGFTYDFDDCSGGQEYCVTGGDYCRVWNLVIENGHNYAGLYGRDVMDGTSRIQGIFNTDDH